MSAIGISPCPPFVHQQGAPGVLWDGNTVAWYKHNDPVAGCIKDGANRVSFWLDKYNYGIGAELVNQAAWYTAAYWNIAFDANWSQVGNTLVSDGNNGITRLFPFWTLGNTYKIVITIIRNAGDLACYDGTGAPAVWMSATGTYTFYYTVPTGNSLFLFSALFNGTITAFSIKQVTGNHLLQATAAAQPLWSAANGVLFDGINDFMKATAFAYVQPEFIYFVGRQITWSDTDHIFDGNIASTGLITQWNTSPSPNIIAYAGSFSGDNINLILNTFSIIRTLFNGVNSSLQVNLSAAVIGNFGANNMAGFTLGAEGANIKWSNIEVKEIILRRSADNAATQASIYNYLKNINSVP